jgi:hypothetical protein
LKASQYRYPFVKYRGYHEKSKDFEEEVGVV